MAEGTSAASKDKLGRMMDGFSEFEGVMKDATRQRRDLDEHKLEELKREMGVLEKEFSSEVQKRMEMGSTLHSWAESQLADLKVYLEGLLEDRRRSLQANIDALNDRVAALEAQFAADKASTMAEIEARNKELTMKLEEFQAAFEAEKLDRLAREAKIQENLSKHEHETFQRFDAERDTRERTHKAIKDRLDSAVASRSKADEKFQSFVASEIADIKNNIRREEEVREKEDDEIVSSMNRYTQKLQASLHIINSADIE